MGGAVHVGDTDDDDLAGGTPASPGVADWFDDALPRLYGYFIVRVGGRVDIAEDLTQETVLAATASAMPPHVPVMAWLYGIARHKLVDHYRREDQERLRFGRARSLDLIEIGPSPPLERLDLEAIHVRDDIAATLDRVPPRQRAALVLRYFDGCDVHQTAALLDLGIHATESLLARGRAAFRRHYRERTGEFS